MFQWLDRLSDESHQSHRTAARYHAGYVVVYGVLIVMYCIAGMFHWAAAKRHGRSA